MPPSIPVYLETGAKRVFAGALEWPGLTRSGRDETAALQALTACIPRYRRLLQAAGLGDLAEPISIANLTVVERLPGGAGTDFGAPETIPSADWQPVEAADLPRLTAILSACWDLLADAARQADGKPLSKGPRGGGRELDGILQHVRDAHLAYLNRLGCRAKQPLAGGAVLILDWLKNTSTTAASEAAAGLYPAAGPRGGVRWPVRYFIRRSAWHIIDHAWEIEDRVS